MTPVSETSCFPAPFRHEANTFLPGLDGVCSATESGTCRLQAGLSALSALNAQHFCTNRHPVVRKAINLERGKMAKLIN